MFMVNTLYLIHKICPKIVHENKTFSQKCCVRGVVMGMGDRWGSWDRGSEPFEAPLAPHLQQINLTRIKSMP